MQQEQELKVIQFIKFQLLLIIIQLQILHSILQMHQEGQIIETIPQIKIKWDTMATVYEDIDSAPQTFFFTLANMLKLNQSKNVLQIACGLGKLLPMVLDLKNPETFYYATDISDQMIKLAKAKLEKHFSKYQSKLSFQQWTKKQNLQFQVANGEQKIPKNIKFDRIFCNLVLMLTNDAQKMLKNLHESAQQGCLMGVTIWGDKQKNNFFSTIGEAMKEAKQQIPNFRNYFHLYGKLESLMQKTGWQVVLSWEQNSMFPFIQFDVNQPPKFIKNEANRLKENVKNIYLQKLSTIINQQKIGFQFWCQLMIVRKK